MHEEELLSMAAGGVHSVRPIVMPGVNGTTTSVSTTRVDRHQAWSLLMG